MSVDGSNIVKMAPERMLFTRPPVKEAVAKVEEVKVEVDPDAHLQPGGQTMHTKGMAVATASSAPAPAPSAAAAAEEEDDEEEKAAREAAAKIQADAEVRAAKRAAAAAAAAKSPDAHLQPGGQAMHTKGMATTAQSPKTALATASSELASNPPKLRPTYPASAKPVTTTEYDGLRVSSVEKPLSSAKVTASGLFEKAPLSKPETSTAGAPSSSAVPTGGAPFPRPPPLCPCVPSLPH